MLEEEVVDVTRGTDQLQQLLVYNAQTVELVVVDKVGHLRLLQAMLEGHL
jgi:hypothetical protein